MLPHTNAQAGDDDVERVSASLSRASSALTELLEALLHSPDALTSVPPRTPHPALLCCKVCCENMYCPCVCAVRGPP